VGGLIATAGRGVPRHEEDQKVISKTALLTAIFMFASVAAYAQQYSTGPRQIGEETLEELVLGKNALIARVASHGCTSKKSFRIEVQKTDGVSTIAPHYVLAINRVAVDECKAIVDDGIVLVWDLEKDIGLKGPFTFSVRNRVDSGYRPYEHDNEGSLVSAVKDRVAKESW
jgi:hypothetical protein